MNPKNASAAKNLAWALSLLGRPEEALDYARQAVALAPDSAEALDAFGTILLQNGIAAEAVDTLDKARKKSPDRSDIQLHFSQAIAAAGRTSEARDVLRGLLVGSEPFQGSRSGAKDATRSRRLRQSDNPPEDGSGAA